MIEFAKIVESVGRKIRVKLRTGEEFVAPMLIVGAATSLPSESWILKNKDRFLAVVTYEKDLLDNPMVIGFYPVNKSSSEDYDSVTQLLDIFVSLLELLQQAKTNTQIGPQPFMPDTQQKLLDAITNVEKLKEFLLKY